MRLFVCAREGCVYKSIFLMPRSIDEIWGLLLSICLRLWCNIAELDWWKIHADKLGRWKRRSSGFHFLCLISLLAAWLLTPFYSAPESKGLLFVCMPIMNVCSCVFVWACDPITNTVHFVIPWLFKSTNPMLLWGLLEKVYQMYMALN